MTTAAAVTYPRLWLDVARDRGVRVEPDGAITADAFADVGIAILNGCPQCEATVGPHCSYQIAADNPYAYCTDCAGVRDEPEPRTWRERESAACCPIGSLHAARDLEASRGAPEGCEVSCNCEHCRGECYCGGRS